MIYMEKFSKILFLIVFALILSLSVLSLNNQEYTGRVTLFQNLDDILENQEIAKDQYNECAEEAPSLIMEIFGNEIIEAQIARNDNSTLIKTFKTEKGFVTEIDNVSEESSLIVELNEPIIEEILNSDNQFSTLEKAILENEINYTAKRFSTKIKTSIITIFFRVSSIFR
jgi:hypothetical protein